MVFVFTQEFVILTASWLGLSTLGLDFAFGWYRVKHFDKIIHLLAGFSFAVFMVDNSFSITSILLLNLALAYFFEFGQLWTKSLFKLRNIGFPDGYYDLAWHMIGTISYLLYKGLLTF